MYFKRTGMPEEGELVLCTVTNIHHHSVFCNIDEYGKTGMIHISEVAPGRIRNLRDYVVPEKKVICKVLKIDQEKGHIDLSLRRVTEMQKRQKNNEIKQEQKAEKMVEQFAKLNKKDPKKLYDELFQKISKKYELLSHCFEEVALNDFDLISLGIEKSLASDLTELIKDKIKPPEVEIKELVKILIHDSNGVDIIKEALLSAAKVSKDCDIKYKGGGKYAVVIKAEDYKKAEKILESCNNTISGVIEKAHGTVEFNRIEKK